MSNFQINEKHLSQIPALQLLIGLGFEFPNSRNRDVFFDLQVGRKSIPITPDNDPGAKNKNSYISFGLRLSL